MRTVIQATFVSVFYWRCFVRGSIYVVVHRAQLHDRWWLACIVRVERQATLRNMDSVSSESETSQALQKCMETTLRD